MNRKALKVSSYVLASIVLYVGVLFGLYVGVMLQTLLPLDSVVEATAARKNFYLGGMIAAMCGVPLVIGVYVTQRAVKLFFGSGRQPFSRVPLVARLVVGGLECGVLVGGGYLILAQDPVFRDFVNVTELEQLEGKQAPAPEELLAVEPWEDATSVPETRRVKVATPEGQDVKEITVYKNPIGMEFVRIPEGEFMMGSAPDEKVRFEGEAPQHPVRITRPFYMSTTEVTVGQYRAFLQDAGVRRGVDWTDEDCPLRRGQGYPLSGNRFGQDPRQPMIRVSWHGARRFCEWLSLKSGRPARLPTEAEWEYACRAGTTTPFSTPGTLSRRNWPISTVLIPALKEFTEGRPRWWAASRRTRGGYTICTVT